MNMKNFITFLFLIFLSVSPAFADDLNYDNAEQQNPIIQGLNALQNFKPSGNDKNSHAFYCPVCGSKLMVQQITPVTKTEDVESYSSYNETDSIPVQENTNYQPVVYYPEKETIIIHDRPDSYHRSYSRRHKKHHEPPFVMQPRNLHKKPQPKPQPKPQANKNNNNKPVAQNQKPQPKPQVNKNSDNKPAAQNQKPQPKPQVNKNSDNKPAAQNQKPQPKPQVNKNNDNKPAVQNQKPQPKPQANKNSDNKPAVQNQKPQPKPSVGQPQQRPQQSQVDRNNTVNRSSGQNQHRPQQSQMSRSNVSRPAAQNHQRPSQSRPQTQSRPVNRSNSQQRNNKNNRH